MQQKPAISAQKNNGLFRIKIFFLLLFLVLPLAAATTDLDLRFKNFRTEDGLSSDWVRCIIQDRLGYLWLATDVGLDRFDGYTFVHYRPRPGDSGSICQSRIRIICETSQGNLWLWSSEGVDVFDPHTGRVLSHIPSARFGYPFSVMEAIRNGEIWIGTWPPKLFRMDGTRGRTLPLPAPLQEVKGYDVLEDASGSIWVATKTNSQYGLVRYIPSSGRLVRYPAGNGGIITMNSDEQGDVWFASESGLDRFVRIEGSFRHFPFLRTQGTVFLGKSWPRLIADRLDRLWISSEYGLRLFDRSLGKYMEVKPIQNAHGTPIFNSIHSNCADSTGNIWLGTFTDGLLRYSERFNCFHYIGYNQDPRAGLIDPHVVSVMEDRQGIIWFTTWGGVLTRYDPENGFFTHYQGAPSNPADHLPKRLYSPLEDISGNLWIGSTVGLVRFDRHSGRFHHVALQPEQPGAEAIAPGITTTIHEEGPDRLLFSTTGEGLFHVNKTRSTYTFQPHRDLFPKGDTSFYESSGTFPDRSGVLWVCTNNGLHCRDPKSGRVRHFLADPTRQGTLFGDWVYHAYEDRSGTMWVATRLGLNRMDRLNGTFKAYTERDGLHGHVIYRIIEDDDGFIWISTNEGISRLDPSDGSFRNFGPSDGVTIGRGWSACRSHDGKLYFTGTNGIVIFDPREVAALNPHIPPVFLTALSVDNRSLPLHEVFSQRDQSKETGQLLMRRTDRMLSVEFAALDLTAPEKNRYAYRLGESSSWNHLGTRHVLTFANLAHGEYTLHVKGSNNDGVWNEDGVKLRIVVLPHYWQTWWFRLLVLLGLALLAMELVHLRRRFVALQRMAEPPNLDDICCRHDISRREQEVLRLVIQGKSNSDIEKALFISIPTVKRHLANIFEKFGVHSRLQLINFLRVSSIDVVPKHRPQDK